MKQPAKLKSSTAIGIFGGCGLASAWYALSNLVLSGPAAAVLPAFGAILIAGTVPTVLLNKQAARGFRDMRIPAAQRLDAFDKHACISIVDENDILTEANDKLLELTGYDRDDLVGHPVRNLYDGMEIEVATEIRSYLRSGKSWIGETRLRHKNGSAVFTRSTIMPLFNSAGNWAGSISVRTDIGRTNRLIAECQTAQAFYELRDDIWIIDSENETLSYLNHTAENRFNIGSEDYLGRRISDLGHPQDTETVLEACRKLKASGTAATRFQAILMDTPVEVSIKFLPITERSGQYLILVTDISERVEQEKQKAAFVSTVSHELRSPLTSIKGAMGLLLSKSAGELPEKAVSLLEIAHRNADRLVLIINDILDLDKMANGEMEIERIDVDLAELVAEADKANAMLQQRFGVKVETIGLDAPVPFNTDPNRFIQVLTNLLSNAYKFSAPNSTIYIEVKDQPDCVSVSVKDQGDGIPQGDQHKIFERFSDMGNSDRALKGGTGLGLNICKTIVENLGGTIGFDSVEGVGTTFSFSLPKRQHEREENVPNLEKLTA